MSIGTGDIAYGKWFCHPFCARFACLTEEGKKEEETV
jgi:hypothetical protein